jgi:predicted kinase
MKLILTIGLPQSGKSTWAKSKPFPIVNRDAIRKTIGGSIRYFSEENRVTEIELLMVYSLFNAGHQTVVVDATHLKKKYRDHWNGIAHAKGYKIDYEFFLTPCTVCMERARLSFPDEFRFPGIIKSMWESHNTARGFGDEFPFRIPYDDSPINITEGG